MDCAIDSWPGVWMSWVVYIVTVSFNGIVCGGNIYLGFGFDGNVELSSLASSTGKLLVYSLGNISRSMLIALFNVWLSFFSVSISLSLYCNLNSWHWYLSSHHSSLISLLASLSFMTSSNSALVAHIVSFFLSQHFFYLNQSFFYWSLVLFLQRSVSNTTHKQSEDTLQLSCARIFVWPPRISLKIMLSSWFHL